MPQATKFLLQNQIFPHHAIYSPNIIPQVKHIVHQGLKPPSSSQVLDKGPTHPTQQPTINFVHNNQFLHQYNRKPTSSQPASRGCCPLSTSRSRQPTRKPGTTYSSHRDTEPIPFPPTSIDRAAHPCHSPISQLLCCSHYIHSNRTTLIPAT